MLTIIAAMAATIRSACVRKADCVSGTGSGRFALVAIALTILGIIFSRLGVTTTDSNQAEDIVPAGLPASSGPAIPQIKQAGKRKEEP